MRGAGIARILLILSESKMKVTARSMRTLVPAVAATAAVLAVFLLLEGDDTAMSASAVRSVSSVGVASAKGP